MTASPENGRTAEEQRTLRFFDLFDRALARMQVNPAPMVLAGAVLMVIGIWVGLLSYLSFEKDAAYRNTEKLAGNLTRTFEEHSVRTIRGIDQTTMFVKREYERNGRKFDLGEYSRNGAILDQFFNLIVIAGPDGNLIMTNRPLPASNVADREHFRVHVEKDTGSLFISKPVLGRSSGKWSIQFTRRINTANGGFGGVVVTSLDPFYLTEFYRSVDLGDGGVAALVGMDGIVRARRVGNVTDIGQDISGGDVFKAVQKADVGTLLAYSKVDNLRRLYAFRKLPNYPFFVIVGISEDVIYAEYFEHSNLLRTIGGLMTVLIMVAALAVLLLLRNQERVQESLRKSEQEALSASRMKSEFLARMSHELRTPLNGILGFSEYLKDSVENPEHREFAATIHQAGNHLLSLVNATLDLAKIEAGRMDVSVKDEDLPALVQRAAAIHQAFAEQKGLRLGVTLDPALPARLLCDATKLVQVLNNLIHNAIKFTEQGGVTLSVSPRGTDILFSVHDTGPGIPAESQAVIFDRFRQLSSFATRTHEGSGLGLALAKELVELMGGRIWLESNAGEGATFLFTLPVKKFTGEP